MSVADARTRLRDVIAELFGDDVTSIVTYGALLFEPDAPPGDLDVHIILRDAAAMTGARREATRGAFEAIHRATGVEIDGWVLARETLDAETPPDLLAPPAVDLAWALHRAHWLEGRAEVLHGEPVDALVRPPHADEIARALREELAYCVRAVEAPPEPGWPLRNAYVVRNAARLLATDADGNPVRSKSASVAWARTALGAEHTTLLDAAERLAMHHGSASDAELVNDRAPGFLAWTRRTLGWTPRYVIDGVGGIPEIAPGDDLAALIAERVDLRHRDVVVIAQKVISKAEGRIVPCPDLEARDAIIAGETRRIVARRGPVVICETHHGFVCANAGVDASNADAGTCILLPVDPDASAERIRAGIETRTGARVGVIVSDTFGRPWRVGQTDVALGVAGMAALTDLRGGTDRSGRVLDATVIATADELAGAAELAMGKAEGVPVVRIRGAWTLGIPGSARDLIRIPEEDLFPVGLDGVPPRHVRTRG